MSNALRACWRFLRDGDEPALAAALHDHRRHRIDYRLAYCLDCDLTFEAIYHFRMR